MKNAKVLQFVRYLRLKLAGCSAYSPADTDTLRQNQRECDHSQPSDTTATRWHCLDTYNKSTFPPHKKQLESAYCSEQKYYLCEYRFKGERWSIEIPAQSWEEAEARLKMLAYGTVKGEIHAAITVPVRLGFLTKLMTRLKGGAR